MIIVSQDIMEVVNFNNITSLFIKKQESLYGIFYHSPCAKYVMGWYKTEKRAKEVLQEIITRHKNWENMKVGQPSGMCISVYEMPEE